MSTPPLVPVEYARVRLGDVARPAAGRAPVRRYAFGACTEDAMLTAADHLRDRLTDLVGPLRCTDVDVELAVGEHHAAELLADLCRRGHSRAALTPAVDAFGQVAAAALTLGLRPVLLVASCAALTGQARASVPFT